MSEVCLPSLNSISAENLNNTTAKAAFVWILGQHGEKIQVQYSSESISFESLSFVHCVWMVVMQWEPAQFCIMLWWR